MTDQQDQQGAQEAILLAVLPPRDHMNGALGHWWSEYRVRPLTDAERSTERTWRYSWVLEQRYCHDTDSEYCVGHDGQWRAWDYGQTAEQAARACAGDSHYMEATSQDALHADMVRAWNRQQRISKACRVLFEQTHEESRISGQLIVNELDVVADEREQAQVRYDAELRRRRLFTAAYAGTAPADVIATIKDAHKREYCARLAERMRRHAAMLAKYRELTAREESI